MYVYKYYITRWYNNWWWLLAKNQWKNWNHNVGGVRWYCYNLKNNNYECEYHPKP